MCVCVCVCVCCTTLEVELIACDVTGNDITTRNGLELIGKTVTRTSSAFSFPQVTFSIYRCADDITFSFYWYTDEITFSFYWYTDDITFSIYSYTDDITSSCDWYTDSIYLKLLTIHHTQVNVYLWNDTASILHVIPLSEVKGDNNDIRVFKGRA